MGDTQREEAKIKKSSRTRTYSSLVRKLDQSSRDAAVSARLDLLEQDAFIDELEEQEQREDEYVVENDDKKDGAIAKIKRKDGAKANAQNQAVRATRGMNERSMKNLRTFNQLLEANELDRAAVGQPTYTSIAAGPPISGAARKFCSVCGFPSPYTCSRCGMRFCSKRCNGVHVETRCLKNLG